MDIGPVAVIHPVTMIKPSSAAAPDLSRVLEAEYLGESRDDEYTPANRKAAGGLEDEDSPNESAEQDTPPQAAGSVSVFA